MSARVGSKIAGLMPIQVARGGRYVLADVAVAGTAHRVGPTRGQFTVYIGFDRDENAHREVTYTQRDEGVRWCHLQKIAALPAGPLRDALQFAQKKGEIPQ